jgi:hypothetical protein
MRLHRCIACLPVVLIIAFIQPLFAQNSDCGINWHTAIQLSSDRVLSNAPQVAVRGDTIHVIWYGLDTLGTESFDGVQYCHSYDGGLTFSSQVTISSLDTAASPGLIACSGDNVYIAFLGVVDTFYGAVIIRSTDAGTTWLPPQTVRAFASPRNLEANGQNVFLHYYSQIDNRYGILWSTDNSATWTLRNSNAPSLASLTTLAEKLHGVIVTPGAPVDVYYYFSLDSARTWLFGDVLSREDFTNSLYPRIATNGQNELYSVWNDAGTIRMKRSRNGGLAWLPEVKLSVEDGAVFADVAADEEFVCVVWDNNINGQGSINIRSSNDFGFTFCPIDFPTLSSSVGEPSAKISGTSLHLAWSETVNGNSEIVYRKGTLTKNPRFGVLPKKLVLEQNYPNPFNEFTHISFEIPTSSHVNVAVYDLLGQRVAQLINEDLQAGRYDVKFSAKYIATGVYFYYLQTPTFTETKKLLITR